jgi:ribosome-binding protein aMBF1 (putative translation factor)
MAKCFRSLKNKAAREQFVESELVNGIAHQIRVLRNQRGWSQSELAERLSTKQNVVSRLEDPSYGRYSIKTLLELAAVFDVAFTAGFVSFGQLINDNWDTVEANFSVDSFEVDAAQDPAW